MHKHFLNKALIVFAAILLIAWFVSYFIYHLPAGTLGFLIIVAIILIIITIIDYHHD